MAIYDTIIGQKISRNHCNTLYFNREEKSNDISKMGLYKDMYGAMQSAMQSADDIPNREEILQCLTIMAPKLFPGEGKTALDSDADFVANAFDAIAYFGIECFCVRRDDLGVTQVEDRAVRAYLINSKIEGTDSRISPALGISSTEVSLGSTSDIVMESFRSKIRLNPGLESLIGIPQQIQNWEMLSDINAGYEFDVSNLVDLLHDMGYNIKIFLQR